jgi:hypothetical protein
MGHCDGADALVKGDKEDNEDKACFLDKLKDAKFRVFCIGKFSF